MNKKEKAAKNIPKNPDSFKSVLFVPYTTGSILAKSLSGAEEKMESLTGYRLKVVERSGTKLEDILHKSNPWQGQDCDRLGCLLYITKKKTKRNLSQDCHKTNIVYETWCMLCQEREEKKVEEESNGDREKMKAMKKKIKLHKYIGESSRSVYKRAVEQKNDIHQLKTSSHLLRQLLDMHEGEERTGLIFGIKVLKFPRSSFERQIMESVLKLGSRDYHLLNSRSGYNNCALPRLATKL